MKTAFRIALICGASPLILGISLFAVWLVTRAEWLMMAGVITIYCGCVAFLAGVIALVAYVWRAYRAPNGPPHGWWLRVLACGILLLSNFPIAFGIVAAVIDIESSYRVVLKNASEHQLSDVRISGGSSELSFGTIVPGGVASRSVRFRSEGVLTLYYFSGKQVREAMLDVYVCNGLGGQTVVTIHDDGAISTADD